MRGFHAPEKAPPPNYIARLTGGLLFDENCGNHPARNGSAPSSATTVTAAYIYALGESQRRELDILEKLPVSSIVINEPQADWDAAYRTIDKFITR